MVFVKSDRELGSLQETSQARLSRITIAPMAFVVANWGVDTAEIPVETALPAGNTLQDVAGRDFTITDKNSEVYTNGIGDPHWIK